MNNVMNVAFITDKNYVIPTAAAIASLIENNMSFDKLYIYIFCDRVCPDDIEKLKSMKSGNVKINVLEVSVSRYEEAYSELYNRTKIHVSPCAMLKFELPLLLPELDKVLYLDGDIIVNSDLREMYNLDIKDYYLAAVDDIGLMKNEWSEVHRRRLGIENLEYFNSGVMLLNLKKLREEEMTSKLIEYRTEGINDFMDQDAFNMCLGKKRLRLPYEYNFQGKILYEVGFEVVNEILFKNRFQYEDECISEQKILHYSNNKTKPWLFNMYFFTDVFDVYLSKTPYKGHKFYRKRLERVFYEEITKLAADVRCLYDEISSYQEVLKCMDWAVPYAKIPKDCSLVIYGAGKVGNSVYERLSITEYCNVVLWVDKNYKSVGNSEVSSPEDIFNVKYDLILIAIYKNDLVEEAYKELLEMGIDSEKITNMCSNKKY